MTLESIPHVVRQQAQLCIVDTVGCVLAGARTAEAAMLMACEPQDGNASATIFGTAQRRSPDGAARINAYLGDVLELNDLIGGHASIGNVTSVLALAESRSASGAAVLEATVRGIEVTTRVYEAIYPTLRRYTEVGMVPVGIPSTLGAAAAVARLMDLDEEQTVHAMAIAGSLAGWCPAEVIFGNGGTVKPLLFGAQPAVTALTAARYAAAGMTGPIDLLDSAVGYFATASTAGAFDPAAWDGRWALQQPRRKLHACCGYLHAPVDALRRLLTRHPSLPDLRVTIRVAPYVADVVSKTRPPISPNDARFHLQYCLAQAACGADVILPAHSIDLEAQLQRQDVLAMMERITVIPDPSFTHYHQASITLSAGEQVLAEELVSAPRGSPQEPLSDGQVLDKFHALAGPVLPQAAAQRFAHDAQTLATLPDVAPWLALLRG